MNPPPADLLQDEKVSLSGARVLLVEDEYYIADDLRRTLEEAGAKVIGPFSTVARAQEAVDDGGFDCAVIDLNLRGESGVPIAEDLMSAGKSFVIATGYGSAAVPDHLDGVPRIEKPFDSPALLQLVEKLGCGRAVPAG